MKFWRKRPPQGGEVSEEYQAGMRAMEEWYHDFVIWAYAYISLLEKRLEQRNQDCCGKCQQRDDKCGDTESR